MDDVSPPRSNCTIHLLGHGKRSFPGANIVTYMYIYITATTCAVLTGRLTAALHTTRPSLPRSARSIKIKPLRFNHVATVLFLLFVKIFFFLFFLSCTVTNYTYDFCVRSDAISVGSPLLLLLLLPGRRRRRRRIRWKAGRANWPADLIIWSWTSIR